MKTIFLTIALSVFMLLAKNPVFAHCDTKDGPVVAAAINAIKNNNINFALIWVRSVDEKEIIQAFESTMKVRTLSDEAAKLADNYFFETLVRLHRAGEGIPYTGIKPSGTPVDKKITAADRSIEMGNLSPLKSMVPKNMHAELKKRFDKVMSLKNFDINNVSAGRKYIESYVQFFHFAEGEHNRGKAIKKKH